MSSGIFAPKTLSFSLWEKFIVHINVDNPRNESLNTRPTLVDNENKNNNANAVQFI